MWDVVRFLGQGIYITAYDKHCVGREAFTREWQTPVAAEVSGEKKKMYTIITGANTGLGLSVARAAMNSGESVILACRSTERGMSAEVQLREEAGEFSGEVKYINCDVSDFESVKKFVSEAREYIESENGTLKCLINNAAIMAAPYAVSKQGYESQFTVNHLGHALLTDLIVKWFKECPHPELSERRIISIASAGAYFGNLQGDSFCAESDKKDAEHQYNKYSAYTTSKLTMAMFAKGVAEELDSWNEKNSTNRIVINPIHPGCIATHLARSLSYLDTEKQQHNSFVIHPDEGAPVITNLMYNPKLAGVNGQFFYITTSSISPPKSYNNNEMLSKVMSKTRSIILPYEN